jgi:hypothetical protein
MFDSCRGHRFRSSHLDRNEGQPAGCPFKLLFCDFASPRTALAQLEAYRAFLTHTIAAIERESAGVGRR